MFACCVAQRKQTARGILCWKGTPEAKQKAIGIHIAEKEEWVLLSCPLEAGSQLDAVLSEVRLLREQTP